VRHGPGQKGESSYNGRVSVSLHGDRYVGGSFSSGRIRLASEIRGGLQVFEGAIIVDADVEPPIINDHEHQDFFIAILKGGSAIPKIEPEELAEWRNYVLHRGAVPQWRQAAGTRSSTVAPEGSRGNDLMSWMSHASGQLRQRWRALLGHGSQPT
jgi:hypothetical protein